jgi:CubicO group peptidase (beta-lactamase class C family)
VYGAGWSASSPHILYSATKSVGSMLVGLAIADGLMQKTDTVCKYVTPPPGADPTLCATTIEDLLHMGSGLAWTEDYSGSDPTASNVLEMLYGDQPDMGAYTATLPRAADAGATFNYSSGDANLLARAWAAALGAQDPRVYAQAKHFGPAGVTSATLEEDRSGTPVFSTDGFMTARDFAKLGQLFLTDGMNGSVRVLPEGWVAYSITPAPSVATPSSRVNDAGPGPGGSYGALWWLNAASASSTSDTWQYPQEPVDGFNAEGHYGQKLVVIPSRQLVLARFGSDLGGTFDPDGMIGAAVAAVDGARGKTKAKRVTPRAPAAPFAPVDAGPGQAADEFQLATGYAAKESCSCVFVEGQSDASCTAYGVGPTGVAVTLVIDHGASSVTATYKTATRVAMFATGAGCTLGGL